jgi:hypothetical protein
VNTAVCSRCRRHNSDMSGVGGGLADLDKQSGDRRTVHSQRTMGEADDDWGVGTYLGLTDQPHFLHSD